ncbi:peptidylprolyl isomerase [Marinoscillum sp. MHG1-6]|uniref:peptidylprolyl isomerase n=1 Tax=Marinoscillum sp. MHG1-6 TaxID=2959627 RepID=UPI0021582FAF|nr:peptidylprolyl isomerase [Marinoscillum sp. MHG1-6]
MRKQNNKASLRFLIVNIFCLTIHLSATGQEPVNIDRIIAKVDDYIILKSDLEKAYLDYLSRGEFRTANVKCAILQQLVQEKMFLAKAVLDSVFVEDAMVQLQLDNRMEAVIARIGSEEELEKHYGKSIDQLKEEYFDEIKEQMIVQKMQQEITQDLKVSPIEVKRFFNKIPQDSLPYFSTEVSVAQIVIQPKAGKEQKQKVRNQMYDIKEQIEQGIDFGVLARQYSEDPGSAARGGQLPFYSRGELAPEFEATAMTLQPGELSDPVETQFGYHLIELQERRGNTFRSRHILISPRPSEKDMIKAENMLDSIRTAILNDSISFQQAAKDFSDDKQTSSNGGFFSDQDGGLRVSVEQLDPTIFFTLDTMTVGNITKPEKFQQPDGSYAYRILYFKDKVPPHLANLDQDYQKIANATLNSKRNERINEYFGEARDNVYIEVDPEYDYCNLVE